MKRKSKLIFTWLAVSVIIALAATAGCQFLTEKATEKAIEKKTGTEIETEKDAPLKKVDTSDIPDELIYSDAKAKSRTKVSSGQGESVQIIFETSDDINEIEKYYDEEPESAGWKEVMKMEQEGVTYTFSKDKSWASVIITKEDNKIQIMVQYVKEMKQS